MLELEENLSTRQLEKKLKQVEKNLSGSDKTLLLQGFQRLFVGGGNRKRDAICTLIADYPYPVEFGDGFSLSQADLRVRERIKVVFGQGVREGGLQKFASVNDDVMSVAERSRRAKFKKRQKADFDTKWRSAIERIAYMKAFGMAERDIASTLKNMRITTRNGKAFGQGTVNRLFHQHVDIYQNLQIPASEPTLEIMETVDGASLTQLDPGPRLDRKQVDVKNIFYPLQFEETIIIPLEAGTFEDKDFYLKFLDRNGEEVDLLFIRQEDIVNGVLTINVLEHTVLPPGLYTAEIYPAQASGERSSQPSEQFLLRVGTQMGELPNIKMVKKLDGKSYMPLYVGDQPPAWWTEYQQRMNARADVRASR